MRADGVFTSLQRMTKTLRSAPRPDPLVGAHHSIAGGIEKAFERAESVGCRTLQVFTKSTNQWGAKPLTEEAIASYKTAASKSSIRHVIAHDSYLINLCATNPEILRKSREALLDEVRRCAALGIGLLNFHPGAHMGAGEREGIALIADSLNWVHAQSAGTPVMSVLETTAGQGSAIGYRFDQLRAIIDAVEDPGRMAVCIDTCHIFAAGYDISTEEGYADTIDEFDRVLGLGRLVAIHTNDSKKKVGSRVDRHEHIGKGEIGRTGFRCLMRDERLRDVPKILETPKGDDLAEDLVNLAALRSLARGKAL